MKAMRRMLAIGLVIGGLLSAASAAEEKPAYTVRDSVIYGRVDNTALTLDVFTPEKPNGAGVIVLLSGGWVSSKSTSPGVGLEFLKRGYTTFSISHGSTPRYTIPEIIAQVNRAVRFVRFKSQEFGVDPNRLGVTGGSAGGHLSLMIGAAGDTGDPKARDPIDRVSSRVQAVACLYPPTDFLNYGKPGEIAIGRGVLAPYKGAFAFHELSETRRYFVPITDEARVLEIGRSISPVYHVSADDAPTLIVHGDADTLVPIQQSQLFLDKLQAAGVATKLIVKPGEGHGWKDRTPDYQAMVEWFDEHLAKR